MNFKHKSSVFVQEFHQNFVLLHGFKKFKQVKLLDKVKDS